MFSNAEMTLFYLCLLLMFAALMVTILLIRRDSRLYAIVTVLIVAALGVFLLLSKQVSTDITNFMSQYNTVAPSTTDENTPSTEVY